LRAKYNTAKFPVIDDKNIQSACPDLISSGECDWILAEAITSGFVSYSDAYSPDSWLDDSDIDRLKELLNLKALRDLSQIPDET